MKQVSIAAYLFLFILLGLSNVFASDNQGYIIQSTQPAVPVENGSRALFNTADMRYERTPLNKLGRGVFNILTFYLEIPASGIRVGKERDNYFMGATLGIVEGVYTSVFRVLTGAFDTVTFIIPPYNKPLMEPAYAVDSLEEAEAEN